MYSLNNDSLEKIVTEYIYADVMQTIQPTMNEVMIKDFFPNEIIDNFDIIISEKNSANVDTTNLKTDRNIIWTVGTLEGNNSMTLEYTLKIKDMSTNSPIYNKEIATNEKVVLTYKDIEAKDYTAELTSSPKIKLTESTEDTTQKPKQEAISGQKDPTIANKILPNTGKGIIIVGTILLTIIIAILGIIKYNSYKDIK